MNNKKESKEAGKNNFPKLKTQRQKRITQESYKTESIPILAKRNQMFMAA